MIDIKSPTCYQRQNQMLPKTAELNSTQEGLAHELAQLLGHKR